jgi:ubiquinone/menaquinone biosynthesis C-methylase UbiE
MTALKEIARVLQPAGVLGMVWNIDDCEFLRKISTRAAADQLLETIHQNHGKYTLAGKRR